MDTIFALATAQGRAGLAVIRISGPSAHEAAGCLMRDVPKSRGVRQIIDAQGALLDEALVLTFGAGRSFTGEAVIELHMHGSPAIVAAVLRTLADLPQLQPAKPGEFTRRALDNGRLDLTQVEGLADLIDAETEQQRKQALQVFTGAFADRVADWRTKLVRAVALMEATIDFVDEAVPVDVTPDVCDLLKDVMDDMSVEIGGVAAAERVRDGFEVAIVGPPNAGKSTLLNRLAGRDVAITSEVAGTTRDVIEVRMDMSGIPVTVLDTAGQRETNDVVEGLGVDRAIERANAADLRVHLVLDGSDYSPISGDDDIILVAKSDDLQDGTSGISGKTGAGVDGLIADVSERLGQKVSKIGLATRERHRIAMLAAMDELSMAFSLVETGTDMTELIAERIWSAVRTMDSVVGRVDVEDVLSEIFSSFCIGK